MSIAMKPLISFVFVLAFLIAAQASDLNFPDTSPVMGNGINQIFVPLISMDRDEIYVSTNLEGHDMSAECNPDDGTDCECSIIDVQLDSLTTHGQVTSNVIPRNTYVNAIGHKKFEEVFPDQNLFRGLLLAFLM